MDPRFESLTLASFSHLGVSSEQYPHDCRHTLTIHRCGLCSSTFQFFAVSSTTVLVKGLEPAVAAARIESAAITMSKRKKSCESRCDNPYL